MIATTSILTIVTGLAGIWAAGFAAGKASAHIRAILNAL